MPRSISAFSSLPLVLAASLGSRLLAASPVLNEIHYHPAGTNVLEEWIELHNPSAAPLALDGWRIDRGVSFQFPAGASIPPNGFLVVAADLPTFTSRHASVSNVIGGWTGTLSDGGETLRLTDPTGTDQVTVDYATEGDWATRRLAAPDRYGKVGWEWFALHDGGGHTLELVNVSLPAAHGQNWSSSSAPGGTPGQPNSIHSHDAAPLILNPRHFPAVPRSDQPVTISTRLLDESIPGLTATLHWRTQSSATFQTLPLLDDGLHDDGLTHDGLFGAQLPAHPNGTLVEFYITASDLSLIHI